MINQLALIHDEMGEVQTAADLYRRYVAVEGAREQMEKFDPSLVDNELIFPTEETLSTTHSFAALKDGKRRQYEGDFADVIGG